MDKRQKKTHVHEHLEFVLEKTTYADRLKWLEQSHQFVRELQRKKNYPNLSRKS